MTVQPGQIEKIIDHPAHLESAFLNAFELLLSFGRQLGTMVLDQGAGKSIDLNSPWDVLKKGDLLYIAMAGSHQIWTLNLKSNAASVFA